MTTYASDSFTGSNGAGWGANWTSAVTDTGASATIQSNKGRHNAGTNSAGKKVDRYSGSNVTDVEFVGKLTLNSSSTAGVVEVWIRGDNAASNGNGYFLMLRVGSKPALRKGAGWTYPLIATLSSAPTLATATEYGVKLYAVGTTVKAKVWATSGGEPAYDYSGTDTSHTGAGQIWVMASNGGGATGYNVDWDDVSYNDGATAVTHAATGSLPVTVGLAGTGTRSLAVYGQLGTLVGLDGAASREAGIQGALGTLVDIAGSLAREQGLTGTLDVAAALAGTAIRELNAAGPLPVITELDGAGVREASASGALPIVIDIDGSASINGAVNATGSLPISVGLSGAGTREQAIDGAAAVTVQMAGVADVKRFATGSLDVAAALAGTAVRDQAAGGDLPVTISFTGDADLQGSVSITGGLAVTVALDGAGTAERGAEGHLAIAVAMTGALLADRTGVGDLAVTIGMSGAVDGETASPRNITVAAVLDPSRRAAVLDPSRRAAALDPR